MGTKHAEHWPKRMPHHLTSAQTDLFFNIEVSAKRYPNKPCIIFYGASINYARFKSEAEFLAGWLQKQGVKKGDRVLLQMQNSPQFMIGYYAILRAGAVVVPVNPMNTATELLHFLKDSGARIGLGAQDLYSRLQPLLAHGLERILIATYSDYIDPNTDLAIPPFIREPRLLINDPKVTSWIDALAQKIEPGPSNVGPDDLCVIPYTSGTTGHPKGCMHTHSSAMHTLTASHQWFGIQQDAVYLATLPFFHVTGMQGSMNAPLQVGATVIVLPRWDRDVAAVLLQRYAVTAWIAIPTMLIDFLNHPRFDEIDISSVCHLSGGGAAMPEAVAQKLLDRGIAYVEGYGLTETMAATHINPPDRPKKQCLGLAIYGVDSRIVNPETNSEVPLAEVGELVISGPQVFRGYWNQDSQSAFIELEGKRFFRTGDLVRCDEDGYYFMVDRLKRMINASGYKVWPAEVEAQMYQHPAVREACVIAAKHAHRGETVKCFITLKDSYRGKVSEAEIIEWAAKQMAAYKYPRIVEFSDDLPKSASGKIQWRVLQEQELAK